MKTIGDLLLRVRKHAITAICCFVVVHCCGQNVNYVSLQVSRLKLNSLDSMELLLATMPLDTVRANFLGKLSYDFAFNAGDNPVVGDESYSLFAWLIGMTYFG